MKNKNCCIQLVITIGFIILCSLLMGCNVDHEHIWKEKEVINASCEVEGKIIYSCTKCKKTKEEVIPALEHDYIDQICCICQHTKNLALSLSKDGLSYYVSGYTGKALNVVIPSTYKNLPVVRIGESAFYRCENITSITIPESITSIGFYAFEDCYNLFKVKYQGTIEKWCNITFDCFVFGNTSCAKSFYLLGENNEYKEVTEIVLPEGLIAIKKYAFYGFNKLTSITIPDTVTHISSYAFSRCKNLTNIKMSKNITIIGKYAFHFCERLTTINLPDTITKIDEAAFSYCYKLSNLKIPKNLTSINKYVFYKCSNLTDITIPEGITIIGPCAFEDCHNLFKVKFQGTIEKWCSIKFESSPALYAKSIYMLDESNDFKEVTKITLPEGLTTINDYTFYGFRNVTSVTIPESVTAIGDYAFENCSSLTNITIPENVTSIGNHAFDSCSRLTNIRLSESLTTIGYNAFDNCERLLYNEYDNALYLGNEKNQYLVLVRSKSMKINSCLINEKTKIIMPYAFEDCISLKSITLPESVTFLGDCSFIQCEYLEKVIMSDNITNISNNVFSGCNNLKCFEEDGCAYLGSAKNQYLLLMKENTNTKTSLIINENTKFIMPGAFDNCTNLESITIPESVKSIGASSLGFSLEKVYYQGTFKQWCNIKNTYYLMAFAKSLYVLNEKQEYEEVTEIVLPEGVTSNEYGAFYGYDNVTSITIPEGETSIGVDAFGYSSSLISIIIPASVTSIGDSAFSNCENLEKVYYQGTLKQWCNITFGNYLSNPMYYAKSIYMLDENNEYKEVTEIILPEGMTVVNDYTFYGFENVTSITIPESMMVFNEHAIFYCDRLKNINFAGTEEEYNAIEFGSYINQLTDVIITYNYSKDNN